MASAVTSMPSASNTTACFSITRLALRSFTTSAMTSSAAFLTCGHRFVEALLQRLTPPLDDLTERVVALLEIACPRVERIGRQDGALTLELGARLLQFILLLRDFLGVGAVLLIDDRLNALGGFGILEDLLQIDDEDDRHRQRLRRRLRQAATRRGPRRQGRNRSGGDLAANETGHSKPRAEADAKELLLVERLPFDR